MEGTGASTLRFISQPQELSRVLPLDGETREEIERVARLYPFRVPEFYANLIDPDDPACPLRLQAVPSILELSPEGVEDPLAEESISPTPTFLKRYPKRGVFLVGSECAMYCRFCNRKRLVGRARLSGPSREQTLSHIEKDKELREVILSGGDPFMLDPAELDHILSRLRAMRHVEVIRISTRFPAVFPTGIQEGHTAALRRYGPLWTIIHVNHPKEISPEFLEAARRLRDAHAILLSQTVLLRGVNDCHHILGLLFEKLVSAGIKPYYLFQLDEVRGAAHFKVPIAAGLTIIRALRRSVSGLCMPHYAIDLTGGLGKVPLEHSYVKRVERGQVFVENLWGTVARYTDSPYQSRCEACGECVDKKG